MFFSVRHQFVFLLLVTFGVYFCFANTYGMDLELLNANYHEKSNENLMKEMQQKINKQNQTNNYPPVIRGLFVLFGAIAVLLRWLCKKASSESSEVSPSTPAFNV